MGALDRIMGYVGLDGTGFELGAKRVESTAEKLGHNVSHHIQGAIAAAFGAAAIEEMIRRTVEWGERISDVSKRLGLTAERYQEITYAAREAGSSDEAVTSFLEKLSSSRADAASGDKKKIQSFGELGVSESDIYTKSRNEIFDAIAKAVQAGDAEQLIAPLREVGGRGAGELVTAFKEGIEEKAEEAKKAGMIMSNETVQGLKDTAERFKDIGTQIMAGVGPFLNLLVKAVDVIVQGTKGLAMALGGFSANGIQGWKDAVKQWNKELKDADEARKKRISAGSDNAVPGDDPGNVLWQRRMDKIAELEEEVRKIEEKNRLSRLNPVERERDIKQKILDLTKQIAEAEQRGDYEGEVALEKQRAELDGQLISLQQRRDRQQNVDAARRVGVFYGASETALVSIAQQQLNVLRNIDNNTKPSNQGDTGGDDESLVDE